MASVSGAVTNAIYKIGSTFGTAVSGGAGNKLKAEITPNFNAEMLKPRQMGSGVSMIQTATRGNFKPTVKLGMDAGYRNCMDNIAAQFFGTAGVPSEQTASQGDYKHTLTFNSSLNAKWGTLAFDLATANVMEFPSCATRSLTWTLSDAPGILNFEAELLANTALTTGTTNTNGSMASATATDVEVIAFASDDQFRLNTNAGSALAGGDQYNITDWTLNLVRPQEIVGEIRGAAGNGAPIATDLFAGTLSVKVKELADNAFYTYWSNETALKCSLNIQGTQIGSGLNKQVTFYIPKMYLQQEPQYSVTSPGVNGVTMNFIIVGATANPSGMSSTLPYIELINNLSTSLLA